MHVSKPLYRYSRLLYVYMNIEYNDMSEKAVHAVLLLHKDSRDCLSKILQMIHYFIHYSTTSHYNLEHLPESQPLLQRYITTLSEYDTINIKETISFLNELDQVKPNTTGKKHTVNYNYAYIKTLK